MLVRYIGPHDEVDIDITPPVACRRGETCDVPDDVAAQLVLQDTWEPAKPDKTAPPAKSSDAVESEG